MRDRLPLIHEDAQHATKKEEELLPVRLRVPKAVAQAVEADPGAAVKAMARSAEETLAAITNKNLPAMQAVVDGKLVVAPASQIEARQGFPFNENPELYTQWHTRAEPPLCGLWDVTDSRTGTLAERWWFDRSSGNFRWEQPLKYGYARVLMHDEFIDQGYAWRGLKEMPKEPYPVPPYNPALLPKEAPLDGKYIKRVAREEG